MTDRLKFEDAAQEIMYLAGLLYARRCGVEKLTDRAGCWEVDIPGGVAIALNPHGAPRRTGDGFEVPGHHLYLTFHGWPTALIGPMGGVVTGGPAREKLLRDTIARAARRTETDQLIEALAGMPVCMLRRDKEKETRA